MKWGADFPSGYGFMYGILASSCDPRLRRLQLSFYPDQAIDAGFTTALAETDATKRGADSPRRSTTRLWRTPWSCRWSGTRT